MYLLQYRLLLCFAINFRVWIVGPAANLIGLALMPLEHFMAIRCALKRRILLSNNVVTAMIAGCWILASLFSIVHYIQPYRLMIEVSMDMSTHCCEYKSSFEWFCEKWITILIDDTRKEDINQQIYTTNFSITFSLISAVFLTITLIYCYIIRVALQASKTKCYFQKYPQTIKATWLA